MKYKNELDKTTLRCCFCHRIKTIINNEYCRVIFRGDNKCTGGKRAANRGGSGGSGSTKSH